MAVDETILSHVVYSEVSLSIPCRLIYLAASGVNIPSAALSLEWPVDPMGLGHQKLLHDIHPVPELDRVMNRIGLASKEEQGKRSRLRTNWKRVSRV